MTDPVGDVKPTVYVDGERISGATGARMTAAEILAFAGKDADAFALYAEGHNGQRLPDEEAVPLQEGARFVTAPRDEAE